LTSILVDVNVGGVLLSTGADSRLTDVGVADLGRRERKKKGNNNSDGGCHFMIRVDILILNNK
jgi:hypothetical protein